MKFKLVESLSKNKDITLEYSDIEVQTNYSVDYWNGPQWDTEEVDWTYYVSEEDCAEYLIQYYVDSLSDKAYTELETVYSEGLDEYLEKYLEEHFDELFEKYYDDLLEDFRWKAEAEANEEWEPYEPDYDDQGD